MDLLTLIPHHLFIYDTAPILHPYPINLILKNSANHKISFPIKKIATLQNFIALFTPKWIDFWKLVKLVFKPLFS